MAGQVDPVAEAIKAFMRVKRVVDEIGKEDNPKLRAGEKEVGAKLRSRAREAPEMILGLGLVPTLSFYLAKARADLLLGVITAIEKSKPSTEVVRKIRPDWEKRPDWEGLASALYIYAVLKYLSTIMGKVNSVELNMEELADLGEKVSEGGEEERRSALREAQGMLATYLGAILSASRTAPMYELLWPYLLQFKRLCEATFESERGG